MNKIRKEIISKIPKLPGIYIYRDTNRDIIYIGKAKNLFNRVSSYFVKNHADMKTRVLVKKIDSIEYIVTNNEVEALLLENNLIKEHKPKYNIQLKDFKSFPMIKISSEPLPRISVCREVKNPKDLYFGPYIDVNALREVTNIITKTLKIRPCKKYFKKPYNNRPCLNFHINKCLAPCSGNISEEEYSQIVENCKRLLNGETDKLIDELNTKMKKLSDEMQYEKALVVREQINNIRKLQIKQSVENSTLDNIDYIGTYEKDNILSISLLKERDGKVLGNENFIIQRTSYPNSNNILVDFLNTYYLNIATFPNKIYLEKVSQDLKEELEILASGIEKKYNKKVETLEVESEKTNILRLAKENSEVYFYEKRHSIDKIHILKELKELLELDSLPRVIECFDIATLNGKYNTAAMSVFVDGKPDKSKYRQFNIVGKGYPDDYAMMQEVIRRRYSKLKKSNEAMPDLILVDGGKGQISSALKSLGELDLNIPLVGLAEKEEHIFFPYREEPLILPRTSNALKMLQAVRDEAHRFSNTRMSKRYKKGSLTSSLLNIEGVGEKRLNMLLKQFKSINGIKNATEEEIAKISNIGIRLARKIHDSLNRQNRL